MAFPILLCLFVLLFIVIPTAFQLYHGGDMMDEMRMRMPKPTLLTTQGIFNLSHHIGMVREQLAFDDIVSCTPQGNGLH